MEQKNGRLILKCSFSLSFTSSLPHNSHIVIHHHINHTIFFVFFFVFIFLIKFWNDSLSQSHFFSCLCFSIFYPGRKWSSLNPYKRLFQFFYSFFIFIIFRFGAWFLEKSFSFFPRVFKIIFEYFFLSKILVLTQHFHVNLLHQDKLQGMSTKTEVQILPMSGKFRAVATTV